MREHLVTGPAVRAEKVNDLPETRPRAAGKKKTAAEKAEKTIIAAEALPEEPRETSPRAAARKAAAAETAVRTGITDRRTVKITPVSRTESRILPIMTGIRGMTLTADHRAAEKMQKKSAAITQRTGTADRI